MLHGQALWRQLSKYKGYKGEQQGHQDDCRWPGGRPEESEWVHEGLGQRYRCYRRGEKTRQSDTDLDGCEKAVGIPHESCQSAAGLATVSQPRDLAFPERYQRDLAAREQSIDKHQSSYQSQLGQDFSHTDILGWWVRL
jgi:hypothetical protein